MSRPPRIDPKLVVKAPAVLTQARDVNELRAAQAILLPAVAHTTLEETAALLGVGRATVARLQQRLRAGLPPGRSSPAGWGGRRRSLMSWEEEKAFLAPWVEQARNAGVLVVSPLRAALGERLGRRVAPSVVYRLLARHGCPASQEQSGRRSGVEKKLPETLAALLTPEVVGSRRLRLMFQDEARLGRMVRPKRCWAPVPLRPVIAHGYEREFVYV